MRQIQSRAPQAMPRQFHAGLSAWPCSGLRTHHRSPRHRNVVALPWARWRAQGRLWLPIKKEIKEKVRDTSAFLWIKSDGEFGAESPAYAGVGDYSEVLLQGLVRQSRHRQ